MLIYILGSRTSIHFRNEVVTTSFKWKKTFRIEGTELLRNNKKFIFDSNIVLFDLFCGRYYQYKYININTNLKREQYIFI